MAAFMAASSSGVNSGSNFGGVFGSFAFLMARIDSLTFSWSSSNFFAIRFSSSSLRFASSIFWISCFF